jgi:hypothetical protein
MNAESFCRAVLLKQPAKVDDLLNALPEGIREELRARLEELKRSSVAEARNEWKRLRSQEEKARMKAAEERSGVDLMRVSPRHRGRLIQYLEQVT